MANTLQTTDLERLSELIDSLNAASKDKVEKKSIEAKIMDFFRESGIKTFHHGDIVIRFTEGRETNEFDPDLLREKYPQIWEECHAKHQRPPHLQIKKKVIKDSSDETDDVPTDEELLEAMQN